MDKYLYSSNSVLATTVDHVLDVIKPRIELQSPKSITFDVGTHLDGEPHLGTYSVITLAFLIAEVTRQKFKLGTAVKISALDNGPIEEKVINGIQYYKNQGYVLSKQEHDKLVDSYYGEIINYLSGKTNVPFKVTSYRKQQSSRKFREAFFEIIQKNKKVARILSPKDKKLKIRVECPECGLIDKEGVKTTVEVLGPTKLRASSFCPLHGRFSVMITKTNKTYLDVNSLTRNLIKETIYANNAKELGILVKGEDWVHGSQLVDLAHGVLEKNSTQIPHRIFAPKITFMNGDKLSKTIFKRNKELAKEVSKKFVSIKDTVKKDVTLLEDVYLFCKLVLSHPNHFYRSYTHKEVERIMGLF